MNPVTPPLLPRAVWFPDWAAALDQADLSAAPRSQYRVAIDQYLRYCKQTRQRATVPSARQFMQEQEARRQLNHADLAVWKEGVNWFFRAASQPAVRNADGHLWRDAVKSANRASSGLRPPAPQTEKGRC